MRECGKFKQMYQAAQTENERGSCTVESLEKHLAQSRQECVDQRVLNEELQEEIKKLKARLLEFQQRL